MNGDFKDSKNKIAVFGMCATLLAGIIIPAIIIAKYNLIFLQIPAICVVLCLSIAVGEILSRGKFSADEKSVVFHVGICKYEYFYNEISDIEVKTGLTHGRYGASAHIRLIINLRNGETVIFHDCDLPDDALSTPEKHKEFQENHQFTHLVAFIKSRLTTETGDYYI